MAKMKRRHHTVTRFYLAGFANQAEQIRRIPLADPGRAHSISITDATVQKDFYLIQEEDGTLSDRVENALDKVESEAALGFKSLLRDREWPISDLTRERIATWVALQHLRGAAPRTMINEVSDIYTKLQIVLNGREGIRDVLNEETDGEASEEEIDAAYAKYSDTDAFKVEVSQNEHIKFTLQYLPEIAKTMYARQWVLIRFQRKTLLTCDHPVVLIGDPDELSFMGVGPQNAGNIYVPLDRHVGLLLGEIPPEAHQGKIGVGDGEMRGTALIAKTLNSYVINNAREAIFTHPDDVNLTQRPLPQPRRQELIHPDYEQWRRGRREDSIQGEVLPPI